MFRLTQRSRRPQWTLRRSVLLTPLAALLLAACALVPLAPEAVPLVRLHPAALGRDISAQQAMTIHIGHTERTLTTLLEADASRTKLAALLAGRTVAKLDWDGATLIAWRAPQLPDALVPERILNDLQLALWPVDSIAAALPPGWSFAASAPGHVPTRTLSRQGTPVWIARTPDAHTMEIEDLRLDYRLHIVTAPDAVPGE